MKSELLGFKYKDIKLGFEYDEWRLKNLGWNIRKKYRNHVDSQEIRKKLSSFADTAIEEKSIDYDLLGPVNDSLLEAQKWRYDKENRSIDPPHTEYWDSAYSLIQVSVENHGVISNFLSTEITQPISISPNKYHSIFLRKLILDLISETLNQRKVKLYGDWLECLDIEFSSLIIDEFSDCKELNTIRFGNGVFEICEMFGFGKIKQIDEVPEFVGTEITNKPRIVFNEEGLSDKKLFSITENQYAILVILNTNNKCIMQALKNKSGRDFLEKFMTAYINSYIDMGTQTEIIDDFNILLSLNLNRIFS
jgi:hypothetical protein